MFFKSLCRVLLTMVIRVSWTGPLPSCRFKGEAAGFHPPPKPHSCFIFLFVFGFVGFNFSCKPQLPVSWACQMKFQPANRAVLQTLLFVYDAEGIVNRGRFYDKHLRSSQFMGKQSEYNFFKRKKNHIFVDICWILAHIIIEVSKFGYFIFSSFIYWHGLIQTQLDYLNLWMQVDLNVKTILA